MSGYQCIIADPPWQYDDKMGAMKSTGNGASSQYHTMPFKDICALSYRIDISTHSDRSKRMLHTIMGKTIADNAHLWLWITNPFLVSGYGSWLCDAWGFVPKSMATWVKGRLEGGVSAAPTGIFLPYLSPATGQLEDVHLDAKLIQHFNQGRYLRGTTEHCLLAVKGDCPALVHDLPNAFVYPGRWPGRLHSEKPPVIHEWAERLSPGPRLELFARRSRAGWDAVGDQLDVDIQPNAGILDVHEGGV